MNLFGWVVVCSSWLDLIILFKLPKQCMSWSEKVRRVLVKLSDALDDQQKKNKVRNIIYEMASRDKTIVNKGSSVKSVRALASKTF